MACGRLASVPPRIGGEALALRQYVRQYGSAGAIEIGEFARESGEPGRNRTVNPQIKSLLLCQLSYRPTSREIAVRENRILPEARPRLQSVPDAPVAQLDRAAGFEPVGRGFKSLRAHQYSSLWLSPAIFHSPHRVWGWAAVKHAPPGSAESCFIGRSLGDESGRITIALYRRHQSRYPLGDVLLLLVEGGLEIADVSKRA